jgi:hypothetical protein
MLEARQVPQFVRRASLRLGELQAAHRLQPQDGWIKLLLGTASRTSPLLAHNSAPLIEGIDIEGHTVATAGLVDLGSVQNVCCTHHYTTLRKFAFAHAVPKHQVLAADSTYVDSKSIDTALRKRV